MHKSDAEGSAKNLNPATAIWEGKNVTRAAPDSPHCRVRNRPRIRYRKAPLIGPGSRPGSEAPHPRTQEPDRHPQTARPRHTPARPEPNPTAKRKTPRTPRQPEYLPRPSPAPGSLALGRVARVSVFSLPVPELWVPRPCVLCKGGYDAAGTMGFVMADEITVSAPRGRVDLGALKQPRLGGKEPSDNDYRL